jgi:hypothetical protein
MARRCIDWPETPRVDDAIYSDEYLDRWADAYVAGGFCYRGVSLMQFLARPRRYLEDAHHSDPLPLLGRQRRIQSRVLNAELRAGRPQRDGEPLDLAWSTRR